MHFVEAKGILSAQNGMNIYRGCTHGCIYCDSRSKCYQINHDFEDVAVKINAPALLEKALRSRRSPCMISTGSMCDPYMHCEEELGLMRKCLEITDRYQFGICLLTKSERIKRDADLLCSINERSKCVVQMTLTTADESLCGLLEPNVSSTLKRVETLEFMRERGIPTVVWMTPILPFINDNEENIRTLLKYCAEVGVKGIVLWDFGVTLREGDREYFYAALDKHFPGVKQKYIKRYGLDYQCPSPNNRRLMSILREECEKHGIMHNPNKVFAYLREFPQPKAEQISMF